jgi:hypothetical protein
MLQELLSPQDCAACKGCCVFAQNEIWEAPETAFPLEPRGECFACRHLTENGCALTEKNQKPPDCAMYPFRVMLLEGKKVIAVSKFCEPVNALPLSQLTEFAQAKSAQFLSADCAAKEYNHEYVILKIVEEQSCTSE